MGIDHTRDKAVWQLIGRGRDRVPDAARALQVRSYLEHVPPELNRQDSHGALDRRFYWH